MNNIIEQLLALSQEVDNAITYLVSPNNCAADEFPYVTLEACRGEESHPVVLMREQDFDERMALIESLRAEVAALKARPTVASFIGHVEARAEEYIALTGQVSGAHWNAMKVIAKEMGIETTKEVLWAPTN
jgi:hypothetical protein